MKNYIRLLRPHHWIKNLLLFLPALFSGRLFEYDVLLHCLFGFIVLCFISSAVYVINDIRDVEKDRLHPKKCKRPIASGAISVKSAAFLSIALVSLTVLIDIFLCKSFNGLFVITAYFVLNIGYSLGLKEYPLVDILILASGFVLRIVYGSVVSGIPVSAWMYLTVMSASLYLGMGKRRNELSKNGADARKVLKFYTYEFLDKNMYICNAIMIIFYSLWCTTAEIIERFNGGMLLTVPLMIVIFMKYSMDIEGSSDGDPVEVVLHDKVLAILCIVYMLAVMTIVYCL